MVHNRRRQQQQPNVNKKALLRESAQRLTLLYHQHLPEVVAESRFDVGKALTNFAVSSPRDSGVNEDREGSEDENVARKFELMGRLHVLRTLQVSDQFVWTNKIRMSPHVHLHCSVAHDL